MRAYRAIIIVAAIVLVAVLAAAQDTPEIIESRVRGLCPAQQNRLQQEAENGDPMSELEYGLAIGGGIFGAAPNESEGVNWITRAAEASFGPAEAILGNIYRTGSGVAKDPAQAAQWLRKAAVKGVADAQLHLAVLYANGHGVRQDFSTALMYAELAKAGGAGPNADTVIGALTARLTPEEVGQAQRRASDWERDNPRVRQKTLQQMYPGAPVPPHIISQPPAEFPSAAKVNAAVTRVWLVIGHEGTVEDAGVEKRAGDGFDCKAIEAVKKWKFAPALKDAQPTTAVVEMDVQFKKE